MLPAALCAPSPLPFRYELQNGEKEEDSSKHPFIILTFQIVQKKKERERERCLCTYFSVVSAHRPWKAQQQAGGGDGDGRKKGRFEIQVRIGSCLHASLDLVGLGTARHAQLPRRHDHVADAVADAVADKAGDGAGGAAGQHRDDAAVLQRPPPSPPQPGAPRPPRPPRPGQLPLPFPR